MLRLNHVRGVNYSLIPRPLPDFISCSCGENLSFLHSCEIKSEFSPQLRDKIWEWPGNKAIVYTSVIRCTCYTKSHSTICASNDKPSSQAEVYLHRCQMTADCTTATTRRTTAAVTATPATADYIQNAGHCTYHNYIAMHSALPN